MQRDELLKVLSEKNFFYSKVGDGETEWEDIPLIRKDYYQDNAARFTSNDFFILERNHKTMCMQTSGSTGHCMNVYWNKSEYMRSMMPLWLLRRKFYGINPGDKSCFFYTTHQCGSDEGGSLIADEALCFCKSNLSESRLVEIYNEMLEFSPKWLQ